MVFLPKYCPHCGHNLALETRPIVKNRCPVCGEDVKLAKSRGKRKGAIGLILLIFGFFLIVAPFFQSFWFPLTIFFGVPVILASLILAILSLVEKKAAIGVTVLILSILTLFVVTPFSCFYQVASIIEKRALKPSKKTETSSIKLQAWTDKSANYKQRYEAKGLSVTINNVRKATAESGLAMPSDVTGLQIWIVVNLTVKNISNESKQSATIDLALPMKIVDVDGNEFTANGDLLSSEGRQQMGKPLLFEEIDKLVAGENKRLTPGQEVTGNIWFSVSEKSQGLKLQRFGELVPPFEEQLIWPLKQ